VLGGTTLQVSSIHRQFTLVLSIRQPQSTLSELVQSSGGFLMSAKESSSNISCSRSCHSVPLAVA
jgi:hypothetical protein